MKDPLLGVIAGVSMFPTHTYSCSAGLCRALLCTVLYILAIDTPFIVSSLFTRSQTSTIHSLLGALAFWFWVWEEAGTVVGGIITTAFLAVRRVRNGGKKMGGRFDF